MYSVAQAMAGELNQLKTHFEFMSVAAMMQEVDVFNERHEKAKAIVASVIKALDADDSNQLAGAIMRELEGTEMGAGLQEMAQSEPEDATEDMNAVKEMVGEDSELFTMVKELVEFSNELRALAIRLSS